MPLVSSFTLRFFEFSIAVAVADRSRVGETNVYVLKKNVSSSTHMRTDNDHYDR